MSWHGSTATRRTLVLLALLSIGCGAPGGDPIEPPPPAAAPPAVREDADPLFRDAAAETGLDFVHWNGMTGRLYYAEMMGAGVALLDYDRDGDLDVYLVQGNLLRDGDEPGDAVFPPPGPLPLTDRLYRNDLVETGALRFADVTEESGIDATGYGMGALAADFDRDGFPDLYVTNLGRNQMWRNRGDGSFEDVTAASGTGVARWSVAAVALDYDRDGRLDLFVGNYLDYSPALEKRCTDELGAANYCGPLSYPPLPDNLLRNLGGLRFEDTSGEAGIAAEHGGCLGAAAADFDGDGWLDLYVANDGLPNQLWINRGDGTFENRALFAGAAVNALGNPEASMGVAVADVDRDGDEDLFLSHLTRETNTLYENDGGGLFTDRSSETGLGPPSWDDTGFGTGFFDLDNDGWLDQLTVNGAVKVIKDLSLAGDPFPLHQRNRLLRGRGDASGRIVFEDVTDRAGSVFALSEVSRGAAFGDLDNDGDVDVVVTNNGGPARLLLNVADGAGRWLGLRLVDETGADVPGARAGVFRAGAPALWRRVGATASYASSSDPRLHFGLGDDPALEKVVVVWPDGGVEEWLAAGGAVAVDAYATLRKGTGRPVAGGTEP